MFIPPDGLARHLTLTEQQLCPRLCLSLPTQQSLVVLYWKTHKAAERTYCVLGRSERRVIFAFAVLSIQYCCFVKLISVLMVLSVSYLFYTLIIRNMMPRLVSIIAVNTGLRVPFGTRPLSKNSRLPMYYGPVSPSSDGNMGPYKELTSESHLNLTVVYLGWALVEAVVPPGGPAKCTRNQPVFLHLCAIQPWVSVCVC